MTLERAFGAGLVLVPVALLAHFSNVADVWVFALSALAIIPLAKFLGEATEELATHSGPAFGGLLNVTFGNATELIIGFFALNAGLIDVVKASITGSIIGNLLLVLGMSIFAGGIKHKTQKFNKTAALASASTLLIAVTALVVPAIFQQTSHHIRPTTTMHISELVAILMFMLYFANLFFMFKTHKHLYSEEVGKFDGLWSVKKAITVLAVTTGLVAWLSEIMVSSIKPALVSLGWTELFIGAVVIAIIGNAAEHTSAVVMAMKNRMDLSLQIAIGSATQIALFVVPILVFAGLIMGQKLNLVFNPFELIAIILAVLITNLVVSDGESNWLEGAQLLAAYGIIAVAFFFFV